MDVRHPMGCYIHFLSKNFFMIRSVKAKEQSKLKITRNDRHYFYLVKAVALRSSVTNVFMKVLLSEFLCSRVAGPLLIC